MYKTKLDNAILIKRSAVQFLVDKFGDFPNNAGKNKLVDVLDRKNIKESISILNNIIRDFADVCDSDEGPNVSINVPNVPVSHTWWRL